MKTVFCSVILVVMVMVSASGADEDWTQKSPEGGTKPSARYHHGMAYIGARKVLLFGGNEGTHESASRSDETWVYDLSANTWTQKTISGDKPSARFYHAMAYLGEDQVLLFGGEDGAASYDDETWVYDLSANTWTQKTISGPSGRRWPAMAYIGDDRVLLFGGYDVALDDETWVYDLSANTWTKQDDEPGWGGAKPSVRELHAMACMGGGQVLLFGGDGSSLENDSWVYDLTGNAWTEDLNPAPPSARRKHTLCETSLDGSSYLVLFGGYNGSNNLDDTWTFGGGDYPLPVELSSFTAQAGDGGVTLRWVTESETDNLGFHIYRAFGEDAEYERLTAEVIQGAGTATSSREYAFPDIRLTNGITYWYKLEDVAFDGTRTMHGPIAVTPQAEVVAEIQGLPAEFELSQNVPNPFNPSTTISYDLPEASDVTLTIFTVTGQDVATVVSGAQEPGHYEVMWDGSGFANGVYLYRLEAGDFVETRRMLLLK